MTFNPLSSHTFDVFSKVFSADSGESSEPPAYVEDEGITFDRYWVGGTATWDGTAGSKWSTTSGGAGGASVPTTSHNVIFDENSGTGTVTLATGATCKHLSFNGFGGTISHNSGFTMALTGGLTLTSANTYNKGNATTSAFNFTGTSGSWKIRTGGKSLGNVTYSGVGGTWTFDSNFTSAGTLALNGGTLNLNSKTVTVAAFTAASTGNTRVLNMSASNMTCNGTWNTDSVTGITVNAGTSTVTCTGTQFSNSNTLYNVVLHPTTSMLVSTLGTSTFTNLTHNSSAGGVQLAFSGSHVITGTLTMKGVAGGTRALMGSATTGSAVSITASNTDIQDMDIVDITATTHAWNLSSRRVGNIGNNTNITFPAARNIYWVGNTGNYSDVTKWSSTSGGSADVTYYPAAHDNIIFDANSFTSAGLTFTVDATICGGLDFTNVSNSPTFTKTNSIAIIGDFILKSGMTHTGNFPVTMGKRSGTANFNQADVAWPTTALTISCPGATTVFQSDVNINGTLSVLAGTVDFNDYNITATNMASTGNTTRTVNMGNGTTTLNSTGNVVNISGSNMTLNAEGSTLLLSNTTTSTKTFNGAGKTFNNLTVNGALNNGIITVNGGNTFAGAVTLNPHVHLRFANGTTTTFQGDLNINGTTTPGYVYFSSTSGVNYTFSKASGTVNADYMSVSRCTATGGATWNATNSLDNGNNTGWNFL